jgi:NitT/TauT family transport system substrate-binding protein
MNSRETCDRRRGSRQPVVGLSKVVTSCLRAVGLFVVGLTALFATTSLRADDDLSLLLDFAPWGLHAGAHLAAEKGWFKEQGLNVTVRDGRGSINTIQLVGAGEADVGMAQLGPMATAREQGGVALKSIAGWVRKGDLAAVVDKNAGIHTIADLKGKKLALFAASPFLPFLDTFLAAGGLTRDDVNLLYVEPSAMLTTYTSGQADGVLTAGPFGQALAERVRPASLVLAESAGISYPSYGYFATEEVIAKKGDLLRRFLATQVRAFEYIYDGHVDEAVAAIISQRSDLKLDPEVLKNQIELYRPFFTTPNTEGKPFGWQAEADWENTIKSMVAAGVLSKDYKPSDFYTNTLLGE